MARHTTGFKEFAEFVSAFSPEVVSEATGLGVEQLRRFAWTVHRGKRVSFWWTMGVNQGHEATRTAQAIINLALMTGNIGRPGTGANSITGQCNAMGLGYFPTRRICWEDTILRTPHIARRSPVCSASKRRGSVPGFVGLRRDRARHRRGERSRASGS